MAAPIIPMVNQQNESLDPSLQASDMIDEELIRQLCSSEDIWNDILFPDLALPDEIIGIGGSNDVASSNNWTGTMEEYPGLTTPPESPPDVIVTTPQSSVSQSTSPVAPPITAPSVTPPATSDNQQFIDTSFLLSNFPSPPLCDTISPQPSTTPPASCSITPPASCSITPPTPPTCPDQQLLNTTTPANIITSNGQLVQVMKSGEVVPISALLSSLATTTTTNKENTQVKQEIAGQKRPHPSNTVTSGTAGTTLSAPETKLSKRQQKLIKNRESASLSRQKKKEYVTSLESKLKEAAQKNLALLNENEKLKGYISSLEKENQSLRYRQPGSPLSTAPKPAMVFVVMLCFTVAFFPLRSYWSSPPTVTSLTVPHNPSMRALMSIDSPNPPLMNGNELLTSQQIKRILKFNPHAGGRGGSSADTVCSCPVITDKHNATRASILNSKLSISFDREEMMIMNMLEQHESNEDLSRKIENSLIVVDDVQKTRQPSLNEECYCHNGVFKFYKSLKKSMTRNLSNYYLVSFKDHLLLNARLRNETENPMLSVIIPAHNGTYDSPHGSMAMLQLDCQVLDSSVFHMEVPN